MKKVNWLDFYVAHENNHMWSYCGHCGLMVVCGTCNNNCCNGGHGQLPDGSPCPDCDSAYKFQDYYIDEAKTYYSSIIDEIQLKKELADE